MSMRHPKVMEWERRLKAVFDQIDRELESRYGNKFLLHPARAALGSTADPSADGLFDLGAAFTAGFGSKLGRGYVVQIRLATLQDLPANLVQAIEREVLDRLKEALPRAFPGRTLRVERDGHAYKIVGDLSLTAGIALHNRE